MLESCVRIHGQFDLILFELFVERFPHHRNDTLECSVIESRIVDHIYDAKEVARRVRGEVIPQVHRNAQHDRILSVAHRHLPERRLNKERRAQLSNCRVALPCGRQERRHRYRPLKQVVLQVLVLIAAQVIGPLRRGLLPLRLSLFFLIVFAERVVLPVFAGRPASCCLDQVQSVPDPEILRQDRLEELKGPRPVCQNMVHLQVDPAPVIINSV